MADERLAGFLRDHPVTTDIPVAWGEMDALGHVNNVVYFRYFETARIALFEKVGFSAPATRDGIGPILASTDCRFRRPLTHPDTVTAASWIDDMGEDEFLMGYAIFSHAQGRVVAEGTGRIVAYDYSNHRRGRLDADLRRKLAKLTLGD